MQQLLCEPEDRLGSQTTGPVFRTSAFAVQPRRSERTDDGAEMIKVYEFPTNRTLY